MIKKWFIEVDARIEIGRRMGIMIECAEKPTPENFERLVKKHGYDTITQEDDGFEDFIGWDTDTMSVEDGSDD